MAISTFFHRIFPNRFRRQYRNYIFLWRNIIRFLQSNIIFKNYFHLGYKMFYVYVPTFIMPSYSQNKEQNCYYVPCEIPKIDFQEGNCLILLKGQRKLSNNIETGIEVGCVDQNQKKQIGSAGKKIVKQIDEEYRPSMRESKFKKICQQPQNRNIIPNVIRLVVTFIQRPSKSQIILQKLLQRQNHPYFSSSKRYYLYQTMIKNKMHNYVNLSSLAQMARLYPGQYELFSQEEQSFYIRLTRVMINYFMRGEVIVSFLVSKRMEVGKRKLHLKVLRDVMEMLWRIFKS